MKIVRKIILVIALCLSVVYSSAVHSSASEKTDQEYKKIIQVLDDYAGDEMHDEIATWVQTLLTDKEMGVKGIKSSDVTPGNPFFVFQPDKEIQNGTVYYPLIANNKVIGILSMTKNKGQWNLSVTGQSQQVDVLNQMEYAREPAVFYVYGEGECGNAVQAENARQTYNYMSVQGNLNSSDREKKFKKYSYTQKVEYIVDHLDKLGMDSPSSKEISATLTPLAHKQHTFNPKFIVIILGGIMFFAVSGIVLLKKK